MQEEKSFRKGTRVGMQLLIALSEVAIRGAKQDASEVRKILHEELDSSFERGRNWNDEEYQINTDYASQMADIMHQALASAIADRMVGDDDDIFNIQ